MASDSTPKAQFTAVKSQPLTNQVSNTVVKPEYAVRCSRHDYNASQKVEPAKAKLIYASAKPFSRIASATPTNAPYNQTSSIIQLHGDHLLLATKSMPPVLPLRLHGAKVEVKGVKVAVHDDSE